jgi:uncharacterized membrane protein
MASVQNHLRNTFLAGIFAATPIAVTIFVIAYVESLTREPLKQYLKINIPFLGVLVALVLIYLLGLIVNSLLGKWFLRVLDSILSRVPLLKELYRAWKHISLTPGGKEGMFAKVVLIPVENGRAQCLGFTSGLPIERDSSICCVFVPAAPNPINGRLYFVQIADVRFQGLSTEEAFKIILSGGNYTPRELARGMLPSPGH